MRGNKKRLLVLEKRMKAVYILSVRTDIGVVRNRLSYNYDMSPRAWNKPAQER